MERSEKPKVLVLVGAGASVEFGIPTTSGFSRLIDEEIRQDPVCQHGGKEAYFDIQQRLEAYYRHKNQAHFERIYHVMHELAALDVKWRADERKPVMGPFLHPTVDHGRQALGEACRTMLHCIYKTVSQVCDRPERPLDSMTEFFESLEREYIPRVYTTNYDDFIGQATKDRYYTGFIETDKDHFDFDPRSFASNEHRPGLFHLHGSVHLGFARLGLKHREFTHDTSDLIWFSDRSAAFRHKSYIGPEISRMDETGVERSAIITGLDKLGRLQQMPFSFYYPSFCQDALQAELIIIVGSGLTDAHLNTYIKDVRRMRPKPPILYIGWWPHGKADVCAPADYGHQDRVLRADLAMGLDGTPVEDCDAFGAWTAFPDAAAAVWADGFQSFLSHQQTLPRIIEALNRRQPI